MMPKRKRKWNDKHTIGQRGKSKPEKMDTETDISEMRGKDNISPVENAPKTSDCEHDVKLPSNYQEMPDSVDFLNKLSLEVLCHILNYLPLRDILKLQWQRKKLHEAVSMHLRVRKNIDFMEGKLYGWVPEKLTDSCLLHLLSHCSDLRFIYGFHPVGISKRRTRGIDQLSIPGVVDALVAVPNLKGVEVSNIFLLEAILTYLPRIEILGTFKNRNRNFPIPPVNRISLPINPRITSLNLNGVVLPELARMDYVKHIHLQWVKFLNPHPFKEFGAPLLQSFVMTNCAGPTNALKYVPLMTGLAAARSLTRLVLIRVPFLGGLLQHLVEDSWRMRGFRGLQSVTMGACKHSLEVDLGFLIITCANRLEELSVQPSLTKDSFFSALIMADVTFPHFDSLTLGFVDSFPEPGKWTNEELVMHGLADISENPAMITDMGMKAAGQALTSIRRMEMYNCPHLHYASTWFTRGVSWNRLRDLTLRRCHAIRLPDFCRFITMLPCLESLHLENMFSEPPKGCARVGLSAGTGLGVSSALVSNSGNETVNNDNDAANDNDDDLANQGAVNNNNDGEPANQETGNNGPRRQETGFNQQSGDSNEQAGPSNENLQRSGEQPGTSSQSNPSNNLVDQSGAKSCTCQKIETEKDEKNFANEQKKMNDGSSKSSDGSSNESCEFCSSKLSSKQADDIIVSKNAKNDLAREVTSDSISKTTDVQSDDAAAIADGLDPNCCCIVCKPHSTVVEPLAVYIPTTTTAGNNNHTYNRQDSVPVPVPGNSVDEINTEKSTTAVTSDRQSISMDSRSESTNATNDSNNYNGASDGEKLSSVPGDETCPGKSDFAAPVNDNQNVSTINRPEVSEMNETSAKTSSNLDDRSTSGNPSSLTANFQMRTEDEEDNDTLRTPRKRPRLDSDVEELPNGYDCDSMETETTVNVTRSVQDEIAFSREDSVTTEMEVDSSESDNSGVRSGIDNAVGSENHLVNPVKYPATKGKGKGKGKGKKSSDKILKDFENCLEVSKEHCKPGSACLRETTLSGDVLQTGGMMVCVGISGTSSWTATNNLGAMANTSENSEICDIVQDDSSSQISGVELGHEAAIGFNSTATTSRNSDVWDCAIAELDREESPLRETTRKVTVSGDTSSTFLSTETEFEARVDRSAFSEENVTTLLEKYDDSLVMNAANLASVSSGGSCINSLDHSEAVLSSESPVDVSRNAGTHTCTEEMAQTENRSSSSQNAHSKECMEKFSSTMQNGDSVRNTESIPELETVEKIESEVKTERMLLEDGSENNAAVGETESMGIVSRVENRDTCNSENVEMIEILGETITIQTVECKTSVDEVESRNSAVKVESTCMQIVVPVHDVESVRCEVTPDSIQISDNTDHVKSENSGQTIQTVKTENSIKSMPVTSVETVNHVDKVEHMETEHKTEKLETGNEIEKMDTGSTVEKVEVSDSGEGKHNIGTETNMPVKPYKGKSLRGKKRSLVKKSPATGKVSQSCQAVSDEIRETTKKAKEMEESAKAGQSGESKPGASTADSTSTTQVPPTGSTAPQSGGTNSSSATVTPPDSAASSPGRSGLQTEGRNTTNRASQTPVKRSVKRKPNMCDQATSTSDPVIEDDHIQILSIRSKTLLTLTLHNVGVTDLVIQDCPRLSVLQGSSCRVLKKVNISRASNLSRVSFTQCKKLNEKHLVLEVCKQSSHESRSIFLRPMHEIDLVELERLLFKTRTYEYHMCIIRDYSLSPSATLYNRARVIAWSEMFSGMNYDLVTFSDFPSAKGKRSKVGNSKFPWGRKIYYQQGRSADNSHWEMMTDMPWIRVYSQCPDSQAPHISATDKQEGLYCPKSKGHNFITDSMEQVEQEIAELQEVGVGLFHFSIVLYVNMCDMNSSPTPDTYV